MLLKASKLSVKLRKPSKSILPSCDLPGAACFDYKLHIYHRRTEISTDARFSCARKPTEQIKYKYVRKGEGGLDESQSVTGYNMTERLKRDIGIEQTKGLKNDKGIEER